MADLSVNTNINSTSVDTSLKSSGLLKEEEIKDVKENKLLEKVESDEVNLKSSNNEEIIVSEELIDALDDAKNEEISADKTEKKPVIENEDKQSYVKEENTSDIETKIKEMEKEENNPSKILNEKTEEKKEKKEKKQSEVDKEARAENSKSAVANNKKSGGKSSKTTVKLVKNERGKWEAVKPDTPEFSARNDFMRNIKTEYLKENPEPEFSSDEASESESAEHSKWKKSYNKHMQQKERDYQSENKDYQEQYFAYKKAKLKAEALNAKL